MNDSDQVRPDYGGACVTNIVPALLDHPDAGRGWLPAAATDADRVVLVVLDGLGWHQLEANRAAMPTVAAMAGGAVSTVVPSTTATALTSIVTGTPPGEHGVVGYRIDIGGGEVLNALRWRTPAGDARERIVPEDFAEAEPFGGRATQVISPVAFTRSGLTRTHLRDNPYRGYHAASSIAVEAADAIGSGETFVYAYYDGIDKIAHVHGLGEHHRRELVAVDRMVADLMEALPPGVAVVVTADHGLVDCDTELIALDRAVTDGVRYQSGEARLRWLHTRPDAAEDVAAAARATLGDDAWVWTRDEFVAEGLLGPVVAPTARERLGDVAVAARGRVGFADGDDVVSTRLVGRHGSLTPGEMLVPVVVAVT